MSMLMQLGTRAMFAAYAQLQTTNQNIANANTPGYSRQQVMLGTAPGQFSGSGYFGRGVTVQTVTRATNMFLTAQAAATQSAASADASRLTMLRQLERVFGTGPAGLGYAATQVFNAYSELAASPGDMAARQAVLARAEDFASLARSNSDQIEMLQANVVSDVRNAVNVVNVAAAGVADLNSRIAEALATGHTPNDLMDSRDQLIRDISEKIEVSTITAPDGSLSVFVGNGQSLVLGGQSNKLVAMQDRYDPSRAELGMNVAGFTTPLATSTLGGGEISGLLQFQDSDLIDARNRLGQIVAALGTAINTQQSLGIDLSGSAGAPLFELGEPVAIAHKANVRDAFGVPLADITLSVTDPAALKASEYTLEEDPASPGQYLITRLSDGQTFGGLNDGDAVDGFTFALGAVAPQPGDRFLLKPVSTAAAGAALALQNPRGVAAASPLMAAAAATNTGTAAVGSLQMASAPGTPYAAIGDMTVVFTSGTGDYDILDGGGGVLASGTWTAGTPVAFNGFELNLTGVPASGDQFAVTLTAFPNASNGNALAFDAMASRLLVDGSTVSDAYAEALGSVGVRAQGAAAAADTSAAVAARTMEALTSEVGVNLDEEAARLIQYQQAFQAAAKMLQTAQSVMDMLVELGGR
ncbi:MAG: flagellar hook-associated protein FlgK [Burkholderiaceae bacterium]|jgi:flagellar hook-associated protein 1 FlgK|nr:flagellar hook-associated protein FlgK [Aquabacterium sp.]NUP86411.1 flagellar hook-associated protein FlgK [Burkholderiaceae bacterium]